MTMRIKYLLFIIAFCLTTSGCVSLTSDGQPSSAGGEKIAGYIDILTSEAFGGRSPGSTGNELATDWLCEALRELGVAPYANDDYRMNFLADCYTLVDAELTVTEMGGDVRSLVWGTDFFIQTSDSFTLTLADSAEYIFAADADIGELTWVQYAALYDDAAVFFVEMFSFFNGRYKPDTTVYLIQLSEAAFQYMSTADIRTIYVSSEVEAETKNVANVVGRIEGTDRSKAVVITAHFDHVAPGGAAYFPGALDNASGTAALLYITELLCDISAQEPLGCDVILVFCNDEESFWVGSSALASIIYGDYDSLFNINVDCVGITGAQNVYPLSGGNCPSLTEDVKACLDAAGILYSDGTMYSGDDYAFSNLGVPAISLMAEGLSDVIHTAGDVAAVLDCDQIADLSLALASFVRDSCTNVYTTNYKAPDVLSIPVDMKRLYDKVADDIRKGRETRFGEELVPYMKDGKRSVYTYSEYFDVTERIADVKEFGDYRLSALTCDDGNVSSLIYLKEDYNYHYAFVLDAVEIFTGELDLGDSCSVVPIPGMEGYASVFDKFNDNYRGFTYTDGSRAITVYIGKIFAYATTVNLGVFNIKEIDIPELKDFIAEMGLDKFIAVWDEFADVLH